MRPHYFGHGWALRVGYKCAGRRTPHRHNQEHSGPGECSCAHVSGFQGTAVQVTLHKEFLMPTV